MEYVKSFRWLCSRSKPGVVRAIWFFFHFKSYTLFLWNMCPYHTVTIRSIDAMFKDAYVPKVIEDVIMNTSQQKCWKSKYFLNKNFIETKMTFVRTFVYFPLFKVNETFCSKSKWPSCEPRIRLTIPLLYLWTRYSFSKMNINWMQQCELEIYICNAEIIFTTGKEQD